MYNDRYLEVRVLRLRRRWADRSCPIIAASRSGGSIKLIYIFKIIIGPSTNFSYILHYICRVILSASNA